MRRGLLVAGIVSLVALPIVLWWALRVDDPKLPTDATPVSPRMTPRAASLATGSHDGGALAATEGDDDAGTFVYGLVVDENGDPVPNAHVQFDWNEDRVASADGRYAVDAEPGTSLHVMAFDQLKGFGIADGVSDVPPMVKLLRLGGARVHVTVGGQPAAGAEIGLCQLKDVNGAGMTNRPPCRLAMLTGDAGVMETMGLSAGEWQVSVNATEAGEMAEINVHLDGTGMRDLSFDLREARRFEGIVTDLVGKPLHCAKVRVTGSADQVHRAAGYLEVAEGYAFTEKDGRFVLRLAPDVTHTSLSVERKGFEEFDGEFDQSSSLRIRLTPFPHYRGTVVGPGDKPVETFWANGRQGKDGRFEIAIERPEDDGTVPVDISAAGFRYLSETRLARPDLGVFHLEPLTEVAGMVFGSDGGPAAANVQLNPAPGRWEKIDDGHFKIQIDPNDVDSPVMVRAVADDECAEQPVDLAHATGLVLRLAAGECPSVDSNIDEMGPPPEMGEPECVDEDD